MLGKFIAVANIAVSDIERARSFYDTIIGLTELGSEGEYLIAYESAGARINVYVSDFAGTNKATALSWEVDDIVPVIAELKAKGVTFEHYDMPGTTLDGDIHRSAEGAMAWFKDPDGNIMHVYEV